MKAMWNGPRPEIIFFEQSPEEKRDHFKNALKHFLTFLKSEKTSSAPLKFTFINQNGPLINNLSIRDNICLDSIPTITSSAREFTLENHIQKQENPALSKLYQGLTLLDELPTHTSPESNKVAALIKGLLCQGDYLLLENPELHLGEDNLNLFIQSLLTQLAKQERTLLLQSNSPHLWGPYITQMIHQKRPSQLLQKELSFFTDNLQKENNKRSAQCRGEGILEFHHYSQKRRKRREEEETELSEDEAS